MESKKLELTVNTKIVKNFFTSIFFAILFVFVLEYLLMDKPKFGHWYGSDTFRAETIFGESIFENSSKLECAILALKEEEDLLAILIIALIFWVFSIINHFVKFKIK